MPDVGDRVRVDSTKVGEASRAGVVTSVIGQLLRIKWTTGEESSFVPGPGSLSVIGKEEASTNKKDSAPVKAAKATKSATKAAKKPSP
jgi:hypothetical protein